jgi:hypothetical protein
MGQALGMALADAGLQWSHLDGVVCVPSLAQPHFMEAHYLATRLRLLPPVQHRVLVRTIDTGGSGPVTGLLEAQRMILHEGCEAVAVVAGK